MGINYGTITRITISENNVWATEATFSSAQGWQNGAALSRDEETDDSIYATIGRSLLAGETAGEVVAGGSVYSWRAA